MTTFIIRRLLIGLLLLACMSVLLFVLQELSPYDASALFINPDFPPVAKDEIIKQLGLDRPPVERFGKWFSAACQFNFGRSLQHGRPVSDMILAALPNTILLSTVSIVMIFAFGVLVGVLQAVKQYSTLDVGLTSVSLFFYSMPSFWLALMLILIVSTHGSAYVVFWFVIAGLAWTLRRTPVWLGVLLLVLAVFDGFGVPVILAFLGLASSLLYLKLGGVYRTPTSTSAIVSLLVLAVGTLLLRGVGQWPIFGMYGDEVQMKLSAISAAVREGRTPPTSVGFFEYWGDVAQHLVLPAIALGIPPIAGVARYTRSSMLEVVNQDYVRTARAKGLHSRVVIFRHALRNALIPVITLLGLYLPFLMSGAVLVESIFAWPGMGRLIVDGIFAMDFPVIMATSLLLGALVILGSLLADLLYTVVDPRIRYG